MIIIMNNFSDLLAYVVSRDLFLEAIVALLVAVYYLLVTLRGCTLSTSSLLKLNK